MTTIERIATWAAELSIEDIPTRVVEKARWQLGSVLAASLAGRNDPGALKVLAATYKHGGSGASRLLAGGCRAGRPAAVFANAAVSCTFDFDEVLLLGHPGHSSVTVPLVLGEELGLSFADVVAAQVVANEVGGRLGLATFFGPQNGQMIPYLHCASAAVAAGRLLRLDAGRMAHALAVALAQPPAALWPGFLGAIESKLLIAAHGTAMGVKAAELAAEGFTGTLDLLDHPRGFFHRFTFVPLPRALGGLGQTWLSDTLQVKLNAACWYWQAPLDALRGALGELAQKRGRPLVPAEVRRVRVRVPFLAHGVDASSRARPGDRLTANEANFSIPTGVALLIQHGRLVPDDLTAGGLAAVESTVRALAARTTVVHDRALSRRLFTALDGAIDVAGLLGTASLGHLGRALRRLRHEFPQAGSLAPGELIHYAAQLPALVAALRGGRGRDYNLGSHDLSSFVLPQPGVVELELDDGTRIVAEREVEDGALGLPGAFEKAAEKLRAAAVRPLGEETATSLVDALRGATLETPVQAIVRHLDRVREARP